MFYSEPPIYHADQRQFWARAHWKIPQACAFMHPLREKQINRDQSDAKNKLQTHKEESLMDLQIENWLILIFVAMGGAIEIVQTLTSGDWDSFRVQVDDDADYSHCDDDDDDDIDGDGDYQWLPGCDWDGSEVQVVPNCVL